LGHELRSLSFRACTVLVTGSDSGPMSPCVCRNRTESCSAIFWKLLAICYQDAEEWTTPDELPPFHLRSPFERPEGYEYCSLALFQYTTLRSK